MNMKRLLSATFVTLVTGTIGAMAQDPPGSTQQDRGIREDSGRPGVERRVPREREEVIVPAPAERGTVGQGRPRPPADDPPGAEWQDRGINEDAGKPGDGDRSR